MQSDSEAKLQSIPAEHPLNAARTPPARTPRRS